VDDTLSTHTLHHPTCCSSEGRSIAAGKDDDAVIFQILKQPICYISVPARELLISKSPLLHYKVSIHTLSISVISWPKLGKDVVKLCEECR